MTRKELIQQEADIRFPDNPVAQSRFKDGAEWADANPSEANIAMYPTKTLDKYYEYKRKQWIEKAKEWFEQQPETYDVNGVRCYGIEDFEDFKKYIEGE